MECRIIRHKNPKGRVTWHRATYVDEHGQTRCSPRYTGNSAKSRRSAQNWLYANTHVWLKTMHVEQRVLDQNGNSSLLQLGTEIIN